MDAIIGYTGLVGKNLLKQKKVDLLFNSKNIADIVNYEIGILYCCAPSAVKWKINKDPVSDLQNILQICNFLKNTKINKIVLISTIDVYDIKDSMNNEEDLNHNEIFDLSYGQNRKFFEKVIKSISSDYHIVRLPGLFGAGIKKNILYDLQNDNMIENISLNTSYQWFNLDKLNNFINLAIEKNIKEINLFSEPVNTLEIVKNIFPSKLKLCTGQSKFKYNLTTKYAHFFKTKYNEEYIENSDNILQQIENYVRENKC